VCTTKNKCFADEIIEFISSSYSLLLYALLLLFFLFTSSSQVEVRRENYIVMHVMIVNKQE
jgi:hypothetical protein